jgi:hypothetical protein
MLAYEMGALEKVIASGLLLEVMCDGKIEAAP